MDGSLFQIAAGQVVVMFLLVMTGYVASRVGGVKAEARSMFSDLLINIVIPAMIISSYNTEYDPAVSKNLLIMFVVSMAAMLLGIAIAALVCMRMKNGDAPLVRLAIGFGNVGFMGFPLISALFGSEGLLYASMFNAVFNILIWTIGVRLVDREKSRGGLKIFLDIIKKPALIAVVIGMIIYFGQISLPSLIAQPIDLLADMNTPLAMFVVGMVLASGGIKEGVRDARLWFIVLFRLILIPLVVFGLCLLLGIRGMVGAICVVLSACPCASMVSVFAVRYRYDEALGAGAVVVTTLLSIVSLPVFAGLIAVLL